MIQKVTLVALALAATTLAGCGSQTQPQNAPVGTHTQQRTATTPAAPKAPAVNADEAQPQQPGKSVEDIPAANPSATPAQDTKK